MSTTPFDEGRLMQVLVAPIVSEKATLAGEKGNAVTFKVLQDATKPEIKAAVELMFKVRVSSLPNVIQQLVMVACTKAKSNHLSSSDVLCLNLRASSLKQL